MVVNPGETVVIKLRLSDVVPDRGVRLAISIACSQARHATRPTSSTPSIIPVALGDDERAVMRQALAGLLWSKQFYHYVVRDWLDGDPASACAAAASA